MELEKSTGENSQPTDDDELDSFMLQLNKTLQKEKIVRKKKLIQEFKTDHDRLFSLAKIVKPAISGLSDTSNFTEHQLKIISEFEQELKKKKSDTDNDTRDRTAEKRQQVHQQMKNLYLAKTSRDTKTPTKDSSQRTSREQPTESKDLNQTTTDIDTAESGRSFNVPLPEDYKDELPTYQPSLLSGVAEAIEKQKKEDLKREREAAIDDDDNNNNSSKTKKKKKKKSNFDQDHQNYDDWEPPEGQTGDGKTYLNEKYGY
jgi:hypothetical protein